jgi:hypothetical protein
MIVKHSTCKFEIGPNNANYGTRTSKQNVRGHFKGNIDAIKEEF